MANSVLNPMHQVAEGYRSVAFSPTKLRGIGSKMATASISSRFERTPLFASLAQELDGLLDQPLTDDAADVRVVSDEE